MIKMIVTDLDGTLLRRDKTISAYTASVFRRCSERGIKIVFATARPIRAVKMLRTTFPCDALICHNGAVITVGDAMFRQNGIDPARTKTLLAAAVQLGAMRIAVEIDDTLYANFDAAAIWPGSEPIQTDFSNLPNQPADKIIFLTAECSDIRTIELLLDDTLYWEVSEQTVLMVMHHHARKRNAVSDVANQFGISISEVAAFGDDYNDVEMLRTCGIGVAVENAIEEAKAAADFLCPSNEADGVARWIETHLCPDPEAAK